MFIESRSKEEGVKGWPTVNFDSSKEQTYTVVGELSRMKGVGKFTVRGYGGLTKRT